MSTKKFWRLNSTHYKWTMHPITLAFVGKDSKVEGDFLCAIQDIRLTQQRMAMVMSIFAYVGFNIVDWNEVPVFAPLFTWIRFGFYVPLAIGFIFFSYSKFYARFAQPSLMVVSWIASVGLLVIHYFGSSVGFYSYRYAILFTLIFILFFFTLRFIYSLITSTVILLMYNGLQMATGIFSAEQHLDSNILFLFIIVFGAIFAYLGERSARHRYMLERALLSEKEKVIAANLELEARVLERTQELEASYEKLEHMTFHDLLTGLYNRRYFTQALNRLNMAESLPMAVIMADVNGLKLVNDTFGHAIGDMYLVEIGKVLSQVFREKDVIARLSGDEFAVLCPNTDEAELDRLVDQLNQLTQRTQVNGIALSIALGYAIKRDLSIHDDVIFKEAEDLMYRCKVLESPAVRRHTIDVMLNTLHEKSLREEEHAQQVVKYAIAIGLAYGLEPKQLDELRLVALLHDIGKIALEDSLLSADRMLTDEEFEVVKTHVEVGYRILNASRELSDIAIVVLHHHERFDGTGYPMGLKGEAIPLLARILTIADAFDGMTRHRNYKNQFNTSEAIEELISCAGTQFDPKLVAIFVKCLTS